MTTNIEEHYMSVNSPIRNIECAKAFEKLDSKEKLYSYYFTRASYAGSKICYFQRSFESPALFYVFYKIFQLEDTQQIRQKLQENQFDNLEIQKIFVYIAALFQNCGNYLSYGDSKFIPQIQQDKFQQFIKLTKAYQMNQEQFDFIWSQIAYELYEYQAPYGIIGMPDQNGLSSYYSSNLNSTEANEINEFLQKIDIDPLNTRLLKLSKNQYEVRIASAQNKEQFKEYFHKGNQIRIVYGDFSLFLQQVVKNLEKGIEYCANENQKNMFEKYIEFFNKGDIKYHRDASKFWIKDQGPTVETYLGFIESYLDPLKVRAEWEGFVSVVDKDKSKILGNLVDDAPKFISYLPWPKYLENEEFKRPDFTSLDVLSFACSGTPVGINIPNYDDIRQNDGFKNVDLGNAYGVMKKDRLQFIEDKLGDLYLKYYNESLFVIVALHELIGHGSGKLLMRQKDGNLNYDPQIVDKHPVTGEPLTTFYDTNETWHSKFGEISSGYEECKADTVALYLACYPEILEVLLPSLTKEQREDVLIVSWYDVILSGVKGLRYYNAEQKKWGQAHCLAAYAILRCLMIADNQFIQFKYYQKNDKKYMEIYLDSNKIKTTGFEAIKDFLAKLQIYKSIADVDGGIKFFQQYADVDEEMLNIRDIVIINQLPRMIELQHDVELDSQNNVKYVQFEESFEGIIMSQIYHYQNQVEDVYQEWVKDITHFKYNKN